MSDDLPIESSSGDSVDSRRRRPNPWQWLRYAYGARLPEELSPWVLWDVTARGWWVRHLARATVQMAPLIILAALFLPGPAVIVVTTCVGGAIVGYIFSFAAIVEANEYRLVKAGYPQGTGEKVRAARAHHAQQASAAAHRARLQRSAERRAGKRHPEPPQSSS